MVNYLGISYFFSILELEHQFVDNGDLTTHASISLDFIPFFTT